MLSSSSSSNDEVIELSLVVSPDVEDDACKVPKLTNDYVSVALDMACEKSASTENDDDDECERVSDSYYSERSLRGSSFLSALKRRFVWTMAKIDVKTARVRPMILASGKTNSSLDWSRTREAVSTDRDVRDGERVDAESDGGRGNGDFESRRETRVRGEFDVTEREKRHG
jgi:hypothetical protein